MVARQLDNTTHEPEIAWLLKRRNIALNKKRLYMSLYQKAYRLSQPNRNVFDMRPIGQNPGTFNIQGMDIAWYVFDLTLAHATDVWVNELVTAMCPSGKKFFEFTSGTEIPEQEKERVDRALQERTEIFFKYLNKSNFGPVFHECCMDLAVSTAFMTINDTGKPENPLGFVCCPPDCVYADEGNYGKYEAYYRDWTRMPIENAQEMWPGLKTPHNLTSDSNDEKLITLYEILFKDDAGKWQYRIIHEETRTLCYTSVFATSPFLGWRVKKLPGETYGRGPAMDAMPAAGTINQAIYDEIVSANFMALPMYMGFDDGTFNPNNFKMVPNTILAVAPTASGTWPLQPVPQAGNIQWSMLILNELREQIHDIMHSNPLPDTDDPKSTATEILARQKRNLENRAPQDARIQAEFSRPFVERCIEILRRHGHWDDIEVDGKVIEIDFHTPLVQSQGQKEVLEMRAYAQFLAEIYGPQALPGFFNAEVLAPWAAKKLGVYLEATKTQEEITAQMEQVQEQQQLMLEQQQQQGNQ